MGRPLNKKYFGNRNIGSTSTTADDGIGGQGIASIAIDDSSTYTVQPVISIASPDMVGFNAVTASASIVSVVNMDTIIDNAGSGYGDTETFNLTVVTNGGTAVINVTSDSLGAIDTINSIVDNGPFTTISAITSVTGGTGIDAWFVLAYSADSVTITESGSGYVDMPVYSADQGVTLMDLTLTVDAGPAYSPTNHERAIVITANTDFNGPLFGDIIKQTNDRTYKVKTNDGIADCMLVASDSPSGNEAYIRAFDANDNSYFVTKLTSRAAVLEQFTQNGPSTWLFASGTRAHWSLDAPNSDFIVQIESV
jgi:hypothetical protein